MSFVVMTDTSSNLPTPLVRQRDLKEIAFNYYINGQSYNCLDTTTFNGDEFYASIRGGVGVTTSQITPQHYMGFYEPFLKEGKDIIFVSMSSGISGSCNSAHIGAREILEDYPGRRIEIVDTRGASLGEGLIALLAADLRDEGINTELAAARLRIASERMFNVFTVDDLMHLKRGGRLSNLSAMLGTVLQIKPILKGNEEGKIVAFAKVRGRRQSAALCGCKGGKSGEIAKNELTVGIAQAGCREDAEMLISLLKQNRPPKEILTVEYEPVTGSHVGPGALALFFLSQEGVRSYNGESMPNILQQVVTKAGDTASEALHKFKTGADYSVDNVGFVIANQ